MLLLSQIYTMKDKVQQGYGHNLTVILEQTLHFLTSNKPVLAGDKRETPDFVFGFLKPDRDSTQTVFKKMHILTSILT